jgi:redox-sensitive bicupin YhaK (pirin superfamily)
MHWDSLGNEARTEAEDVQVLSTGAGIRYAQYNPEPAWIFQIWIIPKRQRQTVESRSENGYPVPASRGSGSTA